MGDAMREGESGPKSSELVEDEEMVADDGRVAEGSWYSLRTTTREMCRALRESLLETYSRAWVRCGGRFCESRMDGPASRGDDMRCFSWLEAIVSGLDAVDIVEFGVCVSLGGFTRQQE
jgi:hypothetical protein